MMERRWRPSVIPGRRNRHQVPGENTEIFQDLVEDNESPSIESKFKVVALPPDPYIVPHYELGSRIKNGLVDIAVELKKTLQSSDIIDVVTEDEDELQLSAFPVFSHLKLMLHDMDFVETQNHLSNLLDQYEDLRHAVTDVHKDRNHLLFQVAEWFAADHDDLESIKAPLSLDEEIQMRNEYLMMMANFTKLVSLQAKMEKNEKLGKPNGLLNKRKSELGKFLLDKFHLMKHMSMHIMKMHITDELTSKLALQELVDMIKVVRAEHTEELSVVQKKVLGVINQQDDHSDNTKSNNVEIATEVTCNIAGMDSTPTRQTVKLNVCDVSYSKSALHEVVDVIKTVRTSHSDELSVIHKKVLELIEQQRDQSKTIKNLTRQVTESKGMVNKLTDENAELIRELCLAQAKYSRYTKDLDEAQKMIQQFPVNRNMMNDYGWSNDDNYLSQTISRVMIEFEKPPTLEKYKMPSDVSLLRSQLRNCRDTVEYMNMDLTKANKDMQEMTFTIEEKNVYIESLEAEHQRLINELKVLQERQSFFVTETPQTTADDPCKCHANNKSQEEILELKDEVVKWQNKVDKLEKDLADTEDKLTTALSPYLASLVETDEKINRYSCSHNIPAETDEESLASQPGIYGNTFNIQPSPYKVDPREMKLYQAGDIQGKMNSLLVDIMDFVTELGKMFYSDKDEEMHQKQRVKRSKSDTPVHPSRAQNCSNLEDNPMINQVLFEGNTACNLLQESFDLLCHVLNLKPDEYEVIYRSYKISQQRIRIQKDLLSGRQHYTALQQFDRLQKHRSQEIYGTKNMLSAYYNKVYGQNIFIPGQTYQNPNRYNNMALHAVATRRDDEEFLYSEKESQAKLKNTVHMLSMQRCKSDLDARESRLTSNSPNFLGTALTKEKTPFFINNHFNDLGHCNMLPSNKQEMKVGVAMPPKKGLISLSTTVVQPSQQNGTDLSNRRPVVPPAHDYFTKQRSKSIIKRSDILGHLKAGAKLLKDAEEQKIEEEQLSKNLGDYTINDLQTKILEMTDTKSLWRGTTLPETRTTTLPDTNHTAATVSSDNHVPGKSDEKTKEKQVTLPAIRTSPRSNHVNS